MPPSPQSPRKAARTALRLLAVQIGVSRQKLAVLRAARAALAALLETRDREAAELESEVHALKLKDGVSI